MRKKINAQFILITAVAIFLTVFLSVFVCYNLFREEVVGSLKAYAHVIKSAGIFDGREEVFAAEPVEELRITLINEDGTVSFDSNADIGQMNNHGDRPEIRNALENGEAEIVRRSDTLDKNTYYYAIRLDDGRVLRVAKEAGSVWSFFLPLIPILFFMGAALFLICLALAHFLTKSIIAPIEDMAIHMDDEKYEIAYKEMKPFLDTIQKQHSDIVKSSQMRQEFTANVSHELKTPLTAISGYSELIESGIATKEDTVRFSAEIHKSSNRLLMLINDILRLSELDSSEDVLVTETVDLYELAEKCVDMMQVNAEKHHVTLTLAGESCIVQANREMIEEVMYNLCSNAVRYNVPDGSVVVHVGMEGNQAVLTVEDTGIGIPEEDQKRIFERFYRVDKSRSKSTGGTGLGLAIVKHVAAKHGAEIGLWSKTGVGTRMRIVFPENV